MKRLGTNLFDIVYFPEVVTDDLPNLPLTMRKRIKKAIEGRLRTNPIEIGKPLHYSLAGHRRIRVGDYRVVYTIDIENHVVTIVQIQHRKNVYETSRK